MVNLKHDDWQIKEKDISSAHAIRPKTGRAKKNVKTPTCSGCGGGHVKSECFFRDKNCFSCGNKGHISAHCKSKSNKFKSKKDQVNIVLSRLEIEEEQKRKFVRAKINGKNVKLQLDTGSDISIINTETGIKIGRHLLKKTEKVARGISGRKLHFQGEFSCNISFDGKTLKCKVYVQQNASNLFGTDWIVLFNLWELPINSFCNRINVSSPFKNRVTENMIKDLKIRFPQVLSEGLGIYKKTEAKFEVKENAKPIFKQKRNVLFGALEQIDKELERLENLGVISRIEFSEWACLVVNVKKKNNKIRMCADFSTGLNDCLRDHTYPLPSPEDVFACLNGGKIISKLNLSDAYLQVKVEEEY